jgi:hypothetical protein
MAQATMAEIEVPEGGIADFVMSDENLDLLAQEEANNQFGTEGLAKFSEVAQRMASYGRFGDDKIVHVETGEIVVPRALVENNPKLRDSIFANLKEQGIENPEQYVVGNSRNRINPETGLAEFNLFKTIEKGFKHVVKVVKKVLPAILPVALSFTPLGPVYGAALGSGIAGLASGQSIGEALGTAFMGGLTGLAQRGIGALFQSGQSPMAAMGQALRDPFGRFGETIQGLTTKGKPFFTSYSGDAFKTGKTTDTGGTDTGTKTGEDSSFLQKAKETLLPSSPTEAEIVDKTKEIMKLNKGEISYDVAYERATKALTPGMMDYLPLAGAGLAATALAGGFEKGEERAVDRETGSDLIDKDRDKYIVSNLISRGASGPYEVDTPSYGRPYPFLMYDPVSRPASQGPQQFVKKGGEIFPRRTGGIDPNEGIPNKDSVRAMLLPGEFVMTKTAVKGLGNGNVRDGIKSMYAVMRNLESRGRKMA